MPIRKKLIVLIIGIFLMLTTVPTILAVEPGEDCTPGGPPCRTGYDCLPLSTNPRINVCQQAPVSGIFGKIQAPDALKGLVAKDPTGAGGISQFLSNLVALIYSLAAVVLIFMLLWGAFDWMTSEGDKEKLSKAQQKIISALIGIVLFAAAFAIIQVLGAFTGFKFFKP